MDKELVLGYLENVSSKVFSDSTNSFQKQMPPQKSSDGTSTEE